MLEKGKTPRSARVSPYPRRRPNFPRKPKPEKSETDLREWEEARCPICMEHPHNAVLLKCSNHKNGCRPYVCDTSDLHSNCFHQFKSLDTSSEQEQQRGGGRGRRRRNLVCPLCRGRVSKWVFIVNEPAREFMNSKARSCSCEGCEFVGTFDELEAHAGADHPLARPAEVDPARQLDWARMQSEWEIDDLMGFQFDGIGNEAERSELEFEVMESSGFGELEAEVMESFEFGELETEVMESVEFVDITFTSPERRNEITLSYQSNVIPQTSPERRNEITLSGQSNVIPQTSPERRNEITWSYQNNVIRQTSPERHNEITLNYQSNVIRQTSPERRNEITRIDQSNVIPRTSPERRNEITLSYQTNAIPQTSPERRNEITLSYQNNVIPQTSSERRNETTLSYQSNVTPQTSPERQEQVSTHGYNLRSRRRSVQETHDQESHRSVRPRTRRATEISIRRQTESETNNGELERIPEEETEPWLVEDDDV